MAVEPPSLAELLAATDRVVEADVLTASAVEPVLRPGAELVPGAKDRIAGYPEQTILLGSLTYLRGSGPNDRLEVMKPASHNAVRAGGRGVFLLTEHDGATQMLEALDSTGDEAARVRAIVSESPT